MNNNKEKIDIKSEIRKKTNIFLTEIFEFNFWYFIAVIINIPTIYTATKYKISFEEVIFSYYNQILIGIILTLVPILFKLIFGKLPFAYIRNLREKTFENKNIQISDNSNIKVVIDENDIFTEYENESYLFKCIKESKTISEKVYTRAGAYLFIGCLIAFFGVILFYSPIFPASTAKDVSVKLLDYLPRFGALFFIEFIAFFFLKQYKIMLEEYRYYEAIKRKRQDNFNLLEIVDKNKDNPEILKIIIEKYSSDHSLKLLNGETTEMIEAQKIINQDLDLVSKVSDLIKTIKNK